MKIRDFCLLGSYPLVGLHVVKHGLKFEVETLRYWKNFKVKKKVFGSWITPLVGRHVVNEPKVGCHVVSESKID